MEKRYRQISAKMETAEKEIAWRRPRKKWIDVVDEDPRNIGIGKWKEMVRDRDRRHRREGPKKKINNSHARMYRNYMHMQVINYVKTRDFKFAYIFLRMYSSTLSIVKFWFSL